MDTQNVSHRCCAEIYRCIGFLLRRRKGAAERLHIHTHYTHKPFTRTQVSDFAWRSKTRRAVVCCDLVGAVQQQQPTTDRILILRKKNHKHSQNRTTQLRLVCALIPNKFTLCGRHATTCRT